MSKWYDRLCNMFFVLAVFSVAILYWSPKVSMLCAVTCVGCVAGFGHAARKAAFKENIEALFFNQFKRRIPPWNTREWSETQEAVDMALALIPRHEDFTRAREIAEAAGLAVYPRLIADYVVYEPKPHYSQGGRSS